MRYRPPVRPKRGRKLIVMAILGLAIIKVLIDVNGLNTSAHSALDTTKQEITTAVESANASLSAGKVSVADKVSQVKALVAKLDDAARNVCSGPRGSLLAIFSSEVKKCDKAVELLGKASQSANDLGRFIDEEAQLAAVLPVFDSKKSFTKIHDDWVAAKQQIDAIQVSDNLTEAKNDLAVAIQAYADAWGDVVSADNSQNADAYDKATIKLNTTYQALGVTVSSLDSKISDIQTSLSNDLSAYYEQ